MPLTDLPAGAQFDSAPGTTLTDLPQGAQFDATDNGGFWEAANQVVGALAQNLSAAMQGTSPVVRQISGAPNYQGLGPLINSDGGPMWADAQGQWHPVDASRQVVLTDPATGKPTVFMRSENMDESGLTSLGRMLAFGATAPSAVAAPSIAAPVATAIGNAAGSADTRALAQIGRAMAADVKAGGPGPTQIVQGLDASGTAPLTVADMAGENARGLAGQVSRIVGPGRQQMVSALNARDAEAGPRLAQAVNGIGGDSNGNFLVAQALTSQARKAAAPLYGKAYLAPALNPDMIAEGGALDKLMSRPAMQSAALNALNIAKEEGRDPASLGITFNAASEPVFERVPSWQTLDYVKRGLDDVLNQYRDPLTGMLSLDERGNAVNQTRKTFLNLIDQENPAYAAARAAYSGPQQSRGALLQGAQAFNRDPDEIAATIADLSPGDQQFFRLGAANALKTTLAKTASGGNEARAIVGNAYRQTQLRAIFPNAQNLIDAANTENKMFGTRQALLGNSATAGRLAQDSGNESGLLQPLAEMLTAGATHEPVLAAKSGLGVLRNIFKTGNRLTPEIADKVAGYLLQSDPATARAWLFNAFNRALPPPARQLPLVPLTDMSAQQGQGIAFY